MTSDDMELVREYAVRQSEPAFETLVSRYINLVYSTAARQVGDPHLAEEITQVTFIILARKAASLGARTVLPSWLHRTAVFVAAGAVKTQRRRAQREQEAHMQSEIESAEPGPVWELISPLLDSALVQLGEKDRQAVLLHYFQKKTFAEVGGSLGLSEDTARRRTNRALEKLRRIFAKHGFNSTTAALAGAISANSLQVAPAVLTKSVTAVAMTKGTSAGASTLTLTKGALKLMAWTKTKIAVTAAVILALTGSGVTGYKIIQARRATDLFVSSAEIGSDGIIRSRLRFEVVNSSGEMIPANSSITTFSGADIEQLADSTGQDMKYKKLPGTYDSGVFTNLNKYILTLNRPVPPGGKIIWIARCRMDGRKVMYLGRPLIQPTGAAGEFELTEHEEYGFAETLHVKGVCRLPAGAVLLDKQPADLMVVTNHGQVEVRFDGLLPPPNIADSRIRYRLASAAK